VYFKAEGSEMGEQEGSSSSGTYRPMPPTPPKQLSPETIRKIRTVVEQKKPRPS